MTAQKELVAMVADLMEEEVILTTKEMLKRGENPLVIVHGCQQGMRIVGERYSEGRYYLAGLIMAGEILRQVMALIGPVLKSTPRLDGAPGTMLLGTVQDDIHDLGKNIVKMLLTCRGFKVFDLGVNVSPDNFITETIRLKPDIIGLSGLITAAFDSMKDTVSLIRQETANWPQKPHIVIGGSQVDEQVSQMVGADYWVTEADAGVNLCRQLLEAG